MSTIIADPNMLAVLSQMKETTDIVDANGKLMGVYTPMTVTADDARKLFDLDKARETLAREKDQGRPFSEILTRLKSMETKG